MRRIVPVIAMMALVASWPVGFATSSARADTLTAPQVFVRLLDANNQAVALTAWQPLSATLTSLGPYDIGIALQPTSATANRQAVEVDLSSEPGGPLPNAWTPLQPYSPACKLEAGPAGQVQSTGAVLYYHGNGAYAISASMYTEAQYDSRLGQVCSGGPASAVALNVNATTAASIVGSPLIPRTTRKARGFNGLQIAMDKSNQAYRWVCARDPVFHAGGPVTGASATGATDTGSSQFATIQLGETDTFSAPGQWACSAQALGGDGIGNNFATPWATTPAVTIKGEYVRDQARTSLRRLGHGRMRLTVPALRLIAPDAARGRLTLTIYRARCTSFRTSTIGLDRVIRQRARLDRNARAVFDFRSPNHDAFYLGRLMFSGAPLILPGPDAPIYLEVSPPPNPSASHSIRFVDPRSWGPCP